MRTSHLPRAIEAKDASKASLVEPILTRQYSGDTGVDGFGRGVRVAWRLVDRLCRDQDTSHVCYAVLLTSLIAPEVDCWEEFSHSLARR